MRAYRDHIFDLFFPLSDFPCILNYFTINYKSADFCMLKLPYYRALSAVVVAGVLGGAAEHGAVLGGAAGHGAVGTGD